MAIIEKGIQSNCSELIIRLDTEDKERALEILRAAGFDEYFVHDYYGLEHEENNEWDNSINIEPIIESSKLNKEIKRLHDIINTSGNKTEYTKAEKELKKKYGISFGSYSFCVLPKGSKQDEEFGARAWLGKYPFHDNSTEITLWYHQHCQSQGFAMLKKISERFNREVEAHDGGSINQYESWLNGEEDEENV